MSKDAAVMEILTALVNRVRLQGWVPFGTHAYDGPCPPLEFSDEVDEGGDPKWERIDHIRIETWSAYPEVPSASGTTPPDRSTDRGRMIEDLATAVFGNEPVWPLHYHYVERFLAALDANPESLRVHQRALHCQGLLTEAMALLESGRPMSSAQPGFAMRWGQRRKALRLATELDPALVRMDDALQRLNAATEDYRNALDAQADS